MIYAPEYIIFASWGPRAEPPESIAARYLACTERLRQIHPAYDNWIFDFNGKPKKLDALRDDLAAAVAANVVRGDDGKPEPMSCMMSEMARSAYSISRRESAV